MTSLWCDLVWADDNNISLQYEALTERVSDSSFPADRAIYGVVRLRSTKRIATTAFRQHSRREPYVPA